MEVENNLQLSTLSDDLLKRDFRAIFGRTVKSSYAFELNNIVNSKYMSKRVYKIDALGEDGGIVQKGLSIFYSGVNASIFNANYFNSRLNKYVSKVNKRGR